MEEKMNDVPSANEEEELENLSADDVELIQEEEEAAPEEPGKEVSGSEGAEEVAELKDKYLRLYADFENYRKRVAKDKEELVKYANESLLYDMLPSLDSLEIALTHAESENNGLVEGVRNTLRELYRTLDKFGLKHIEAEGKAFDPEYHHAMAEVERGDMDEKMVVEEFRRGFTYRDKVLRASLVSVSRKPSGDGGEEETTGNENTQKEIEGGDVDG